jgi:hypothetical protein
MKRTLRIGTGLAAMLGVVALLAGCGRGESGKPGTAQAALREANMVYYAMPG